MKHSKTTAHQLVTKFRNTGSVCDMKRVASYSGTGETLHNIDGAVAHTAVQHIICLGMAFGHCNL
jgi:hypothetical protein